MAKVLETFTHVYSIGLFGWTILSRCCGDRWWWLFLLNTFAVYLFIPVPILLIIALILRRRKIWISLVPTVILTTCFYGILFLPKLSWNSYPEQNITVMTYNVLGFNEQLVEIITAIQAAEADVVTIQELNPSLAQLIEQELTAEYPHQVLDPQVGVCGMGIISRYPLSTVKQDLSSPYWCGKSQLLKMQFKNTPVFLVNFHAIPPSLLGDTEGLEWTARQREQQIRMIAEFIEAYSEPVIVLGDLNAAEQSTAYNIITASLSDSWRNGGWGLGHTFPGAASPGSSRPKIGGVLVPMWLVRIDYIFHSDDWETQKAWLGPWDSSSDHRPVVARLTYRLRN